MSTKEKKPLLKYELPNARGKIIVGTEGNGFYVYFKNEITKRESMSIFDFAAGKGATPRFKQRKSKPGEVTLFGFDVDVDSTDKGMAMEEFDSKYGGQIKSTVKRRMGGKVRGYGKAMRGY